MLVLPNSLPCLGSAKDANATICCSQWLSSHILLFLLFHRSKNKTPGEVTFVSSPLLLPSSSFTSSYPSIAWFGSHHGRVTSIRESARERDVDDGTSNNTSFCLLLFLTPSECSAVVSDTACSIVASERDVFAPRGYCIFFTWHVLLFIIIAQNFAPHAVFAWYTLPYHLFEYRIIPTRPVEGSLSTILLLLML